MKKPQKNSRREQQVPDQPREAVQDQQPGPARNTPAATPTAAPRPSVLIFSWTSSLASSISSRTSAWVLAVTRWIASASAVSLLRSALAAQRPRMRPSSFASTSPPANAAPRGSPGASRSPAWRRGGADRRQEGLRRRRSSPAAALLIRRPRRVLAEHAPPRHRDSADRGDARERLEPGDEAHPHQPLDEIVLHRISGP